MEDVRSGTRGVAEGVVIVTLTDPNETMNLRTVSDLIEHELKSKLHKRIIFDVEAREVERA